jgi:hypothetical protein
MIPSIVLVPIFEIELFHILGTIQRREVMLDKSSASAKKIFVAKVSEHWLDLLLGLVYLRME